MIVAFFCKRLFEKDLCVLFLCLVTFERDREDPLKGLSSTLPPTPKPTSHFRPNGIRSNILKGEQLYLAKQNGANDGNCLPLLILAYTGINLSVRPSVKVFVTFSLIRKQSEAIKMNFNPLPNNKILGQSKLKAFAEDKINVAEKFKSV